MNILSLICVIIFLISFLLVFLFIGYSNLGCAITAAISIVSFIIGIFAEQTYIKEQPKEFPANKYILEYKIEVYPAYSDTTYVLIPIK